MKKIKRDYITINKGFPNQMSLCIGIWEDDVYTPLNRDELEWHLISRCWDEDKEKYPFAKPVARIATPDK